MEIVLNIYILYFQRLYILFGGFFGGGFFWLGVYCCCGEWVGFENRLLDGGFGGLRLLRGFFGLLFLNR